MKQRVEPVHVEADARGVPRRLYWRGRLYCVIAVEDQWRYAGKWWLDGRGWRRAYFRVTARCVRHSGVGSAITLEVFREGANWVLSRECD
jgi:hypothetical protein